MRRPSSQTAIFLAVIALATLIAIVTSISSPTVPVAAKTDARANSQPLTPTPVDEDLSQPGSTDGIILMGLVISAIVLLPLLTNRLFWRRAS